MATPTQSSVYSPDQRPLPPRLAAARSLVATVTATARSADEPVVVSIVIPSYQHRDLVLAAAAAALAQTTTSPYEVLVVDNGSTDGTAEALAPLVAASLGRLRVLRLPRNHGRSVARNAGIALARGAVIAFTDADCCPTPGWLAAGLAALADPDIEILPGRTTAPPGQRQPFFCHFIETTRLDGNDSTANVFYRRTTLERVDGFDPRAGYWEDADLGSRVRRAGGLAAFCPTAVVYHQIRPLSPLAWLRWPWHLEWAPALVARYPERRRYLVLGLWVDWFHVAFDVALGSLLLGLFVNRRLLVLVLPYLVAFQRRRGLAGRWPPLKALLHVAWDCSSLAALVVSSIRHRTLVL